MKLDILSARNTEVEKLNEAFDVVFPYSKISNEDRIQTLNSKIDNEEKGNSSGQKKTNNYYSENTE